MLTTRVVALLVDPPREVHRRGRWDCRVNVRGGIPGAGAHGFNQPNLLVEQRDESDGAAAEVEYARRRAVWLWAHGNHRGVVRPGSEQVIAAGKAGDRAELVPSYENVRPVQA